MPDIVISVGGRSAGMIVSGEQTAFVSRQRIRKIGGIVYVYDRSSERIVATCRLSNPRETRMGDVFTVSGARLTSSETEWFSRGSLPWAYDITDVRALETPIGVEELGIGPVLAPFRYVRA